MIKDIIGSISFDCNKSHEFGVKSGILWAHHPFDNCSFPLLYISKPKYMSRGDFDDLLSRLDIQLRK